MISSHIYSAGYFSLVLMMCMLMSVTFGVHAQDYTTCKSFDELVNLQNAKYPEAIRITSSGTTDHPTYHGFFFYNCSPTDCIQFDPTGRYMLGMKVSFEGRLVQPTDIGHIGIIDTEDNYKWIDVGQSTAWNWQQGSRLQWIPGSSEEFFWNDRSDDGKKLVCRIHNMRTGKTRVLPRPVYTVSPDGLTGLTHDFERMIHRGTSYVGIEDKYAEQWAPKETGIWKMNMISGKTELIMTLDKIADIIFKVNRSKHSDGTLYIFREGWNPSGTRFIAFVKYVEKGKAKTYGYSMNPDGTDVRYLYSSPSHHYWIDDETIIDWGRKHFDPEQNTEDEGYFLFKDDGSGKAKKMLWKASNGHDSFHKNGEWILTDTYNVQGYQYLYLYHLPTKLFVPLGKFEFWYKGKRYVKRIKERTFRVDLHPRLSPDGNIISFDSSQKGLGRQIYMMDISHIIANPPSN